MHPNHESPQRGWLSVEEIRLVSDLRIMHAKVDELCQLVRSLKKRHDEVAIHKYADHQLLGENIEKIDEICLWFVKLNEGTPRSQQPRLGNPLSHRYAIYISNLRSFEARGE